MPFYTHKIGTEPETGERFDSKQDALSARTDGYTVSRVLSADEKTAWRDRESARFDDGTYCQVPWADKLSPWRYGTSAHVFGSDAPVAMIGFEAQHSAILAMMDHHAHISLADPGKIAYTPDDAHGADDRQIRTTPARYLTQFATALYTSDEINALAATVRSITGELQIARTADEIVSVYMNGPRSCMSGHNFDRRESPVRVYGGSDLGVAYLGDINTKVSARCIVWPDKKLYGRAYGDESVITAILRHHGYTEGSMRGAHVQAIESDHGGYVMPYVDGISSASLRTVNGREMFRLDNGGDYDTQNTDGTTGGSRNTCAHCNGYCDEDTTYCSSCEDERNYCDRCGEDYFDSEDGQYFEGAGEWRCNSCAENTARTCQACDETFNELDFERRERASRNMDLCADCHDDHDTCADCNEYHTHDELQENESGDRVCADCMPEPEPVRTPARPVGVLLRAHSVGRQAPITVRTATGSYGHTIDDYTDLGSFAAHRTIATDGTWLDTFTLTHKLSGLAVSTNLATLDQCKQTALALSTLDWGFTGKVDMPIQTRTQAGAYLSQIGAL